MAPVALLRLGSEVSRAAGAFGAVARAVFTARDFVLRDHHNDSAINKVPSNSSGGEATSHDGGPDGGDVARPDQDPSHNPTLTPGSVAVTIPPGYAVGLVLLFLNLLFAVGTAAVRLHARGGSSWRWCQLPLWVLAYLFFLPVSVVLGLATLLWELLKAVGCACVRGAGRAAVDDWLGRHAAMRRFFAAAIVSSGPDSKIDYAERGSVVAAPIARGAGHTDEVNDPVSHGKTGTANDAGGGGGIEGRVTETGDKSAETSHDQATEAEIYYVHEAPPVYSVRSLWR